MARIGKAKAIELMAEAVSYMGEDYVYPPATDHRTCKYVHLDSDALSPIPSCIVGHALFLAGIEMAAIVALDGVTISTSANSLPQRIGAVTKPAAEVFQAAQDVQDDGFSWGMALNAAKAKAATRG